MSYEEKIKREILKNTKLKRLVPYSKKVKPIFDICPKCHNKTKHHHFLCDKCWLKKQKQWKKTN
jgi:predicted amidophosphoribosyltransferase